MVRACMDIGVPPDPKRWAIWAAYYTNISADTSPVRPMKLGLLLGYAGGELPLDLVLEAERLGFESVWSSEAYGADAVSPAAWVLARTTRIKAGTAIMQMPARTPALAAMTAMTLDALSGGRFILGLGASGPQVVEGWHGVAYGKPVERARIYRDHPQDRRA